MYMPREGQGDQAIYSTGERRHPVAEESTAVQIVTKRNGSCVQLLACSMYHPAKQLS